MRGEGHYWYQDHVVDPPLKATRDAAALTCAQYATDADDLRQLLLALGLIGR